MSSQQEEQEMEAEALTAIFDTHFSVVQGTCMPFVWHVELWPEANSDDQDGNNHVGVQLEITLPEKYPDDELSVPQCQVTVLKGLTPDHAMTLQQLAQEEAEANAGVPSVFAICERLREWLVEHNQKGHDDVSMHAQMLRRKAEAEKKEQQQQLQSQQYESQKAHGEMSEAEREELELRRKRAEGTPVNRETFEAWKAQFEQEQTLLKEQQAKEEEDNYKKGGKQKKSTKDNNNNQEQQEKKGRLTGFQHFSDKAFNLEALEAAAENAQRDPDEEEDDDDLDGDVDGENENINEELFDVDDEEVDDLDDLDFDDDDDDNDEDVDI